MSKRKLKDGKPRRAGRPQWEPKSPCNGLDKLSGSHNNAPLTEEGIEGRLAGLRRASPKHHDGDERLAGPIGYLRKHGGLPPTKKSLGQFWLLDPMAGREIARILDPGPGETVIEVGPGAGALTEHLLASGAKVKAVEIDGRMVAELKRKWPDNENLEVVHDDILRLDLSELSGGRRVNLVGNLPYHITASLLFNLLDTARNHPGLLRRLVVLVQLEVARRIAARPGDSEYGILSVFVRLWGEPRLELTIDRERFQPVPKVDAGVIRLDFAEEPLYPLPHWPTFKRLVKGAFGKRRKMLRNSIPGIPSLGSMEGIEFDWTRRPQTVSAEEFAWLAQRLIPKKTSE